MKKLFCSVLAVLLIVFSCMPASALTAEDNCREDVSTNTSPFAGIATAEEELLSGYVVWQPSTDISGAWGTFSNTDPGDITEHGYIGTIGAAAFAGGKVYGFMYASDPYGGASDTRYFIMDPDTMLCGYNGASAGVRIIAMAYNHAENAMYAIGGDDIYNSSLFIVDLQTGALQEITTLKNSYGDGMMAFTIDTEGNAYALSYNDFDSRMYTVDLNNGNCTLIGNTGIPLAFAQAITYSHATDTLYWAQHGWNTEEAGLYTLNTKTGEATLCGETGAQIVALFARDELEIPPVEMLDVEVTFVDGLTGEEISGGNIVAAGTILDEADFPAAPSHEGFAFLGWDYDGSPIYSDFTITAEYQDLSIIRYSFETDPFAEGWTIVDEDGDSNNWMWSGDITGRFNSYDGSNCMASASYSDESNRPLNPDNWLISPSVPGGGSVSFWIISQDQFYSGDSIGVYVSVDGGETWSNELGYFTSTEVYTQYSISLEDYEGQDVVIGFRHYNSSDMYYVNVDKVEVQTIGETIITLMGDIDGDGALTVQDALTVMRCGMGLAELTNDQMAVGDMDGDGVITISDATTIMRVALGL